MFIWNIYLRTSLRGQGSGPSVTDKHKYKTKVDYYEHERQSAKRYKVIN
jgi:hypothetical protein